MASTVTGQWDLHKAVVARWAAAGLDTLFRNEWPAAMRTRFSPLADRLASPDTPHPYCVYQLGTPRTTGHSTGAPDTGTGTYKQYEQVQLQFTVHAKKTASEDPKALAARMMKLVAAGFDPKTRTSWDCSPQILIKIELQADFEHHEGPTDEFWSWVRLYELTMEKTLDR